MSCVTDSVFSFFFLPTQRKVRCQKCKVCPTQLNELDIINNSKKWWKTSVSIYLILFQGTGHDLICYKCLKENVSNDLVTLCRDICLSRNHYYRL